MKKSIFALISLALILTACQSSPTVNLPSMQGPNPSVLANASQATPVQAKYSFRKPQGVLYLDFDGEYDKNKGFELFKEFMRKYTDDNDIFNYQIVEARDAKYGYGYNINIYGGEKEFVLKKLLPDILFYLKQRVKFDNYGVREAA
jgi:hypothetical protein